MSTRIWRNPATRTQRALAALRDGPKTNADLQDTLEAGGAEVASFMTWLVRRGLADRTLGKQRRATYSLAGSR